MDKPREQVIFSTKTNRRLYKWNYKHNYCIAIKIETNDGYRLAWRSTHVVDGQITPVMASLVTVGYIRLENAVWKLSGQIDINDLAEQLLELFRHLIRHENRVWIREIIAGHRTILIACKQLLWFVNRIIWRFKHIINCNDRAINIAITERYNKVSNTVYL